MAGGEELEYAEPEREWSGWKSAWTGLSESQRRAGMRGGGVLGLGVPGCGPIVPGRWGGGVPGRWGSGVPRLGAKAGRTNGAEACRANGAEACQDEGCAGMWGGGVPGRGTCRDERRRHALPCRDKWRAGM